MSYCFEDFYEPSEFDDKVEEFKSYLRDSIKEEYASKLERAYKEIEELKKYRDEKNEYNKALKEAQRASELTIKNAESVAKRKRLYELLGDIQETCWSVRSNYSYEYPKCDKCDDNRNIHFKSPSGRDMTEPCSCSKRHTVYYPEERKMVELKVYKNSDRDKNQHIKKYAPFVLESEDSTYNCYVALDSNYAYHLYEGQDFSEINDYLNKYKTYFTSKEDCQKFCDWLNEVKE